MIDAVAELDREPFYAERLETCRRRLTEDALVRERRETRSAALGIGLV